MDSVEVVNRELFEVLLESDSKDADVLVNHLKLKQCLSPKLESLVKDRFAKYFIPHFNKKWRNSSCNKIAFIKKNEACLGATFSVSVASSLSSQSRKVENFEECSERTKKRRITSFVQKVEMGNIDSVLQNMETLNQETVSEIFHEGASSMLSGKKSHIEDVKTEKS